MTTSFLWIVWDLAAVALLALCVHVCARRGFVRTVISFFSYIIAAFAARLASLPLAKLLYDNVVRELLERSVQASVEKALAEGSSLLETAPSFLLRLAAASVGAGEAGNLLLDSARVVDVIIDYALHDPVMLLLQGMCFLVVFLLALFVVKHVARLFTGLNKVPVVGTINTLLGGIVGVLQGVVFLFLGAFAIRLVLVMGGDGFWWLNSRVMEDSYIWHVFYKLIGG